MPDYNKLNWLQTLRGIAALMVVIVHDRFILDSGTGKIIADNVLMPFAMGVDLFFIISGFLMVLTTSNFDGTKQYAWLFMIKRISRIWPTFAIVSIIALFIQHQGLYALQDISAIISTLEGLIFLPHDPAHSPIYFSMAVNVAWTLCFEAYFYLVFGIAMLFGKKRYLVITIWFALTLLIIPITRGNYNISVVGQPAFEWSRYASLAVNPIIWDFIFGMICGQVYLSKFKINNPIYVYIILVGTLSFVIIAWTPLGLTQFHGPAGWGTPLAILFMGIVLFSKLGEIKVPQFTVWLGGVSYSLYLFHLFAFYWFEKILAHIPIPSNLVVNCLFVLRPIFAVIIAAIAFRYIETPSSKWMLQLLLGEKKFPILLRFKVFCMSAIKKTNAFTWRHLFFIAILIVGYVFTAITPPFQAPDEFDHVKRAYMFEHGKILLHSVNGSPSGGKVDTGLMEYMHIFDPLKGNATHKISSDEIASASTVKWKHTPSFETPVGSAYYFPALYTPQAIGLKIGELVNLPIDSSYYLARFFTLFACIALIFFANKIFTIPLPVLAILILPMNLFLMSSVVLDGVATAVAILALSAFMRIIIDKKDSSPWIVYTLIISIALLVSCRANTLPFLLIIWAAYYIIRDKRTLISTIIATVFALTWTIYTVKFTVYPVGPRHIDHTARLLSYILHPLDFFRIVFATLSNSGIMDYYRASFIGVLGWLDAPFSMSFYNGISLLLVAIVILSISFNNIKTYYKVRLLIVLCVVSAILLTFLALLVQWTVGPATTVDGVQGRYFTIPAIALIYALCSEVKPKQVILRSMAAASLITIMFGICVYATTSLLINRYYTTPTQPLKVSLKASTPLTRTESIPIHFSPVQTANPAEIEQLDLRFGTYMNSHVGQGLLRLWTNNGDTISIPFELSELVDNAYKTFLLDNKSYVGGEIISQHGGEGVSLYETTMNDSFIINCMVIHTHEKSSSLTSGCPQP